MGQIEARNNTGVLERGAGTRRYCCRGGGGNGGDDGPDGCEDWADEHESPKGRYVELHVFVEVKNIVV